MLECGFIKLHRSILKWEWYDDLNTRALFFHLLLTVNYEDNKWHGRLISRGSRVTSLAKLAEETKLSVKSVRTALKHLNSTGEVASVGHSQNTVISVLNYDKYQQDGRQAASNGQLCKKEKKEKETNLRGFLEIWNEYPKQQNKNEAIKAWEKLNPSDDLIYEMSRAIVAAQESQSWQSEGGRYVPMLSTWLNNRRWEDEAAKPPEPQKMKMGELDEW